MAKQIGMGYSFREKSIEKENEDLKENKKRIEEKIVALTKENEELKAENAKLKGKKETKEPTVAEIKAKLDELKIEYNSKANKEELLSLLPQE